MEPISPTDYRNKIIGVDKYGRKKCDRCGKRRKVNVYWPRAEKSVCKSCSHEIFGITKEATDE